MVRIGRKSSLGGVARSFSRHKWDLVVKNSGTWASYRMPEMDVTGIDFSISGQFCLWDGACQALWREVHRPLQ